MSTKYYKICINRASNQENAVKFCSRGREGNIMQCPFLEAWRGRTADGGEADTGKPDVSGSFQQLVPGVVYLHDAGVIHKDIKVEHPWDERDNFRISNFGLAQCFGTIIMHID